MIGWDCLPLGQALSGVILVAEGRAITTFWSSEFSDLPRFLVPLNKNFYGGSSLTTLYFFIMQPIGLMFGSLIDQ